MPARLRDIVRAVQALGGSVDEPNSGSHWKARFGTEMYPLPAHNGLKEEISDIYIRAMCRNLRLDYETLKKHL